MKTTIDIPIDELKQLIKYTGEKTKKGAIVQAVKSFNKRQRMIKLTKMLGTFENFMDSEELENMRKDEP